MIWIVREIIGEYDVYGNTILTAERGNEVVYCVGNSDSFRPGDEVFLIHFGSHLTKTQESKLSIPPKLTDRFDVALRVRSFFPLGVDRHTPDEAERLLGLEHTLRR